MLRSLDSLMDERQLLVEQLNKGELSLAEFRRKYNELDKQVTQLAQRVGD